MALGFSNLFNFRKRHGHASVMPAEDSFSLNNPNYNQFTSIDSDIASIINAKSVIAQNVEQINAMYSNPTWQTFSNGILTAIPEASNKQQRIDQYRKIAKYAICDWCLDEICDDFIHEDENSNFITLTLPSRLNSIQHKILQDEFYKFISFFDFRDSGYNMIKRFLIEGELAWENIINPKFPDLGIIGIKFLPAEHYETLRDVSTGTAVGLVFNAAAFSQEVRAQYLNPLINSTGVFNAFSPISTYQLSFDRETSVPLLWPQVTYINSGVFSDDQLTTYSLLEKAKQQYHRLALLEDSAIILRVTHAPERLLFNISTGRMNQHEANEYAARFAQELKSKKVATTSGDDAFGIYDAPTMLQSYIFTKGDGNDGTTVDSVGSKASYDELGDVEYFLRQFMKVMKVPFSRFKTPENTMEKNDNISYEEYSFSRMIIRFQKRFAAGLKAGFITHLRLRGLFDKKGYELQDTDLQIQFVKPVLYDLYETQKLVTAKMDIYKSFKDTDFISQINIMKKYLGWTDDDVTANFELLIKEKQMNAIAEMFAEKISPENPPVEFKSPIKLKSDMPAGNTAQNAENQSSTDEPAGNDAKQPEPEATPKTAEIPSFGLG